MLDEKNFLPLSEFNQLRQELLELCNKLLAFLQSLDPNIAIISVRIGDPLFSNNGAVTIPLNPKDKGVIFHEVGHALFAKSVFHLDRNDCWGESFAEAIRWLMEKEYLKNTDWLLNEFEKDKTKHGHDKEKAERILRRSGHSVDGFKRYWRQLIADYNTTDAKRKATFLDDTITG